MSFAHNLDGKKLNRWIFGIQIIYTVINTSICKSSSDSADCRYSNGESNDKSIVLELSRNLANSRWDGLRERMTMNIWIHEKTESTSNECRIPQNTIEFKMKDATRSSRQMRASSDQKL